MAERGFKFIHFKIGRIRMQRETILKLYLSLTFSFHCNLKKKHCSFEAYPLIFAYVYVICLPSTALFCWQPEVVLFSHTKLAPTTNTFLSQKISTSH